jgi:hypothetical protein
VPTEQPSGWRRVAPGGAGAQGGYGAAEPRAETATWVGQRACVGGAPSGDGGRQARHHIGGQSARGGAGARGVGRSGPMLGAWGGVG